MSEALAISDDALKLLVAEHGVRGTARLLQMDERQSETFRKRAQRAGWLNDPAIAGIRAVSNNVQVGRPALPVVPGLSPQAAIHAELVALGQKTRLSLAKGIAKAGEHVETLDGAAIVADAGNVKSIAQTADLIHGWKDAAPAVKIRLDVLGSIQEQPIVEVETTVSPDVSIWEASDNVDDY